MTCPICGKEIDDELTLCPICGAQLSADPICEETIVVDSPDDEAAEAAIPETERMEATENDVVADDEEAAVTAEDATDAEDAAPADAETPVTAAPPAKNKSNKLVIGLAAVIIVLLLAIIACLGLSLKYVSNGGSLSSILHPQKKLRGNDIAVTLTDADGNEISTLNNAEFSFYYWGEFYYFINRNGFVFDTETPLSEQIYMEANSAEGTEAQTWQDLFMTNACNSYLNTKALVYAAEAEGFTMSDEQLAEYQAVIDALPTDAAAAGYTDEAGNGMVEPYIQESYGSTATQELFEQYIYDSYYASAYSDSIYNSFSYTDDRMSAYYDENADYFLGYGIQKSELPDVSVRHILVSVESDGTDEDGNATISDEAWAAAEQQAEEILQSWKDGDATEDSFAALAQEKSSDPGSSSNGGLYENVYPGQMVTTFNDWCFDADRKPGDTDIVKSDYGFHVMYFVKFQDTYYWKTNVDGELRYADYVEKTDALSANYTADLTKKADVRTPDAVTSLIEQVKAQNAAQTTQTTVG